jgi:hypothetical protein
MGWNGAALHLQRSWFPKILTAASLGLQNKLWWVVVCTFAVSPEAMEPSQSASENAELSPLPQVPSSATTFLCFECWLAVIDKSTPMKRDFKH